jgi:hypothetical protein
MSRPSGRDITWRLFTLELLLQSLNPLMPMMNQVDSIPPAQIA